MATSLDGKISQAPGEGPNFTSRFDRDKLFRLRAEADILLVGAQTVRVERLPPLIRSPEYIQKRRLKGYPEHPAIAVVSQSLNLPWKSDFFTQAQRPFFLVTGVAPVHVSNLAKELDMDLIETGTPLNLKAGLHQLYKNGFQRLLCEGGGHLVSSLLNEDLVDEIHLTIAPTLISGMDTPSLTAGERFVPQRRFTLKDCQIVESELHLCYQRA